MDTVLLSLIVGITSSLLATGIFIGSSEAVRRILLPWYADKIYRGVRIDGRWELSTFEDIDTADLATGMYLDLTQSGDTILGTYSHKDADGTVDLYELSGRIRDRYFLATAVPMSNRHIDGLSLVMYLQSKQSKLRMSGKILFSKDPGGVDNSGQLVFTLAKP